MLTLHRVSIIEQGAFGVLLQNGIPFAVTLERTYEKESDAGVSQTKDEKEWVKIPNGFYPCRKTWFIRGGYYTYEVIVPGHTEILFHKGAIEDHSEGCILLGTSFGIINGKPGILESQVALWELFRRENDTNFFLEIKD